MFAAASSLEAENDAYLTSAIQAVNIFVALAPVAYVSNQRSKVIQLLAESDVLDKIYARGVYEFLPYGPINEVLVACRSATIIAAALLNRTCSVCVCLYVLCYIGRSLRRYASRSRRGATRFCSPSAAPRATPTPAASRCMCPTRPQAPPRRTCFTGNQSVSNLGVVLLFCSR